MEIIKNDNRKDFAEISLIDDNKCEAASLSSEVDRPIIIEGKFSILDKILRAFGIAKELSS